MQIQAGMKRNVSKLSAGPRCISRSPKVDAITGNERPVSRKNKRLQFPVFPTGFPHPNHVRAFHKTAIASDRTKSRLRHSSIRNFTAHSSS